MTTTYLAIALAASLLALLLVLMRSSSNPTRGRDHLETQTSGDGATSGIDATHQLHLEMQREQAQNLRALTAPINEKLQQVEERLIAFDKQRYASEETLREQIMALRDSGELMRTNAEHLRRALTDPKTRGNWGELQLRRVVEMAGLSEHCRDFTTQAAHRTSDDQLKTPDMLIHLPNARSIVIDAKTVWSAYLSACETTDEVEASQFLAQHAVQVKDQVKVLAKKDYARSVTDALPDLVVLFLPAEHLFSAALKEHPTLIEEAYQAGVVIATPTTLLSLLHAVSHGWREERLADSAAKIAELGRELHERLTTLTERVDGVGTQLSRTLKAYNQLVGTLDSRVLVTARRFTELDIDRGGLKQFTEPSTINEQPRMLTSDGRV